MAEKFKNAPTKAIVHPLVLLSIVDHYNRIAKDTNRRVIGVLLGETRRNKDGEYVADATNSFAVPFEEDDSKSNIWYLDHDFLENMSDMFRKVNARENVIGWYSSGPRIRKADLEIHEVFRKYIKNPVFVIIDVQPKEEFEIPTKSYVSIEEVREDATEAPTLQFKHITSEIGALEAEEVEVEHLLRDVKDTSISTLASQLNSQMLSLKSLISHLNEMFEYLEKVCDGKLPLNQQILGQLQDIFNTSPNLSVEELGKAFSTKTNDMMVVIFLSSMIRSIIALHSLITNKLELKEIEKEDYEDPKEPKAKEEKESGQEKEQSEIKVNGKK